MDLFVESLQEDNQKLAAEVERLTAEVERLRERAEQAEQTLDGVLRRETLQQVSDHPLISMAEARFRARDRLGLFHRSGPDAAPAGSGEGRDA